MLDDYIGARRSTPLHDPVQEDAGGEDTAQTKEMQGDAGARSNVQEPAPSQDERDIEEYIISVEQVRAHFRAKGLQKSKDTVQRWCRSGDLACRKRGVLNRYFTTEASLKQLEAKLLPDMVADGLGEASGPERSDLQVHAAVGAAAHDPAQGGMQLHAPEGAPARSGMKPDLQLHDAATSDADNDDGRAECAAPLASPAAAPASEAPTLPAPAPTSEGAPITITSSGEVAHLRAQLASKESEIEFLREEIRAARSERSNVVQISHRMMEAMETMVIGGKVDRLNTVDSTRQSSPPEAGR